MAPALFPSLPALRQLLLERFPPAIRGAGDALATGIPALDALTGGLPRPGLTELVCSAPSCGSQLFLGQVLQAMRVRALRAALVDHGDGFDPCSWPDQALDHLVWVRARHAPEAMAAADLLARDANLGLVVLDLRHTAPAELRRIPAVHWYRLQRAVEPATLACLILTPQACVPGTSLRLELPSSHPLAACNDPRPRLTATLPLVLVKQRTAAFAATG